MRARRAILAAALVAAALLLAAGFALWRNPYGLIDADYARKRVAAGLSKDEVVVGDHRWVYAHSDDAPEGAPLVVMLHGFTGTKENWYPLGRGLRGRYLLLIADLPGWGESQRIDGAEYGYVAQTARVAQFIQQVARPTGRPVVLLGHSMGGGIAALVAAHSPGDVAYLGLLDASGVRFEDNRFGEQVLAGQNPFAVHDEASLRHYLDILFFDDKAKPIIPWPADRIYIEHRRQDAAFESAVLDRIGRGSEAFLPGEEAVRIAQPTLLLWCRQDAVIDMSAMALYAQRIPLATQVLLDGCGHMSLMEQPDNVAQAVTMLIERGDGK